MDSRLKNLITIAAITVALGIGVILGVATGIADRVFGGPKPDRVGQLLPKGRAEVLAVFGQKRRQPFQRELNGVQIGHALVFVHPLEATLVDIAGLVFLRLQGAADDTFGIWQCPQAMLAHQRGGVPDRFADGVKRPRVGMCHHQPDVVVEARVGAQQRFDIGC